MNGTGFHPTIDKTYNMGTSSKSWDNIYADDFINTCEYTNASGQNAIDLISNVSGHLVVNVTTGATVNEVNFAALPAWLHTVNGSLINGYSVNKLQTIQNEAIKYLNQKVIELEQNNTILQNKITSLEQRVRAIEQRLGIPIGP